MEDWKKKIKDLSIRKKIISCTYVILIPLMLILCMLLTVYSYSEKKETYQESQQEMVDRLEDAINLLQQEVNYLSLNLSINYKIREILAGINTKEYVEKVELWEEETPIQMMEEIIYLKGYVKTISIYPENGVSPFLRCLDSSSYVPELWALQKSGLYEQAVEKKAKRSGFGRIRKMENFIRRIMLQNWCFAGKFMTLQRRKNWHLSASASRRIRSENFAAVCFRKRRKAFICSTRKERS